MSAAEEWVWGVDLSTERTDIACLRSDGAWRTNCAIVTRSYDNPIDRLTHQFEQLQSFAPLLAKACPPVCVVVEQPMGRTHPNLHYACGAVALSLTVALNSESLHLPARDSHRLSVFLVNISSWKRDTVGHSNASKAEVLAWARDRGYTGDDQDPADALAIATHGALQLGWPPPSHPIHYPEE